MCDSNVAIAPQESENIDSETCVLVQVDKYLVQHVIERVRVRDSVSQNGPAIVDAH